MFDHKVQTQPALANVLRSNQYETMSILSESTSRNESLSWLNYHAHVLCDEPNPCHIYPLRVQASVMVKVHHYIHVVRIDLKSEELSLSSH